MIRMFLWPSMGLEVGMGWIITRMAVLEDEADEHVRRDDGEADDRAWCPEGLLNAPVSGGRQLQGEADAASG